MSFIYNITGNSWSSGPNLITARTGHAIGTLNDGRVIVYSGLTAADDQLRHYQFRATRSGNSLHHTHGRPN